MKITYTYSRLGAAVGLLLSAMIVQGAQTIAQAQDQPQQAQPQPQRDVVLGVVDFTRIMVESNAGTGLKAQADKLAAAFEADYKKQGKAFNDAERKLEEERASLSTEELQKKIANLNAQGKKIKGGLEERKRKIDAAFEKASNQIKDTLLQIVAEIAKKRGMTLVLNKHDTILSDAAYDFSDDAMKTLNDKLPSVKMQVAN